MAPLEIGEPPRKILRPLDAARRFAPAGFAFLQSRHHIMQAAFLRLPTSSPLPRMYRHGDVWSVPDLNNGDHPEDAPIEIAPNVAPRVITLCPRRGSCRQAILMGYRVVAGLAIAIKWLSGNRARPQFQDWHQARLIPDVE